jgi:hypothetical protein
MTKYKVGDLIWTINGREGTVKGIEFDATTVYVVEERYRVDGPRKFRENELFLTADESIIAGTKAAYITAKAATEDFFSFFKEFEKVTWEPNRSYDEQNSLADIIRRKISVFKEAQAKAKTKREAILNDPNKTESDIQLHMAAVREFCELDRVINVLSASLTEWGNNNGN